MSVSTAKSKPSMMHVVACTGDGRTRLELRPTPTPGPGEIRLRLVGCGLCGTDLFKLQHNTAAEGSVLGHEVLGTVDARGPDVAEFEIGDRVVVTHHVACGKCPQCRRGSDTLCAVFRETLLAPGGFSEQIIVRPRAVRLAAYKMPSHVKDEAAVFLEPAACVLRGIWRAGLPQGELLTPEVGRRACVAVLGAGSMGLLHVLLLRCLYPRLDIVCLDLEEDRLQLAAQFGATAACLPGDGHAAQVVQDLTEGLGADAVFDTVGGAQALDTAFSLSREGGTVVLFAHPASGDTADLDIHQLFKLERRVLGTYSGGLKEQREIFQLLATRRFDPSRLVTHRLPLDRFSEAVDLVRDRAALKVLLFSNS